MDYQCPLCGQPVSRSHYNKITGIWKERERILNKIRDERKKLVAKAAQFRKQRTHLIQQAVEKQTKPLEVKINAMRRTQRQLESNAQQKIHRATLQAKKLQHELRQKMLNKIDEQRSEYERKISYEQKRVREESIKLKREKIRLVQQITHQQKRKLQEQLNALKVREEQIENRARQKIHRLEASAQLKAEKIATARLNSLKKALHTSTKAQLIKERRLGKEEIRRVREQYEQLNRSYHDTLAIARTKENELRKQVDRFNILKKQLNHSIKNRLKEERQRGAREVQLKYQRLNNSFRTTLIQMRAKTEQIKKQTSQIRELEKQLRRQTTPQIEGLLSEDNLLKELKKHFPQDKYLHTGKGGDILHELTQNGQTAGVIVYECKRVKHFSANHVQQTLEAKEKRKADFALLVTNAMKKGTQGFFAERGVIIVHPAGVLSFVSILRNQMIRIAEMKLGQRERDKAIKMTLEYLEGPQFSNSMDAIVEESIQLYGDLLDEIEKHKATWKRRYSSYSKVHDEALMVKSTSKALLSGESEYKQLIQTNTLPALPDMPMEKTPTVAVESSRRTNGADSTKAPAVS